MAQQAITIRVIIVSIVLTILLAIANTYLALKIGFLTSASIPAAILSMSILRFFKNATIFENNLIQTAASAGEAVAGGVVYTLPGLIIIGYWQHFNYWQSFFMALSGGLLGIFFSIPLRKKLVTAKELPFPEATAIAKVLEANSGGKAQLKLMLTSSLFGALFDLAQNGFKILATHYQKIKLSGLMVFNFEMGFSPTMIAAGYLIGFNNGLSLLIGSIVAWYIAVPLLTLNTTITGANQAELVAHSIDAVRYIGIGAMLTAALVTLVILIISFSDKIKKTYSTSMTLTTTPEDLSVTKIILSIIILTMALFFFFNHELALTQLNTSTYFTVLLLLFTLVMGFIAVLTACYFSGLVGVSASPGSSIILGCVLIAAFSLQLFFNQHTLSSEQLNHVGAIIIIVISVITAAACIANDNSQDLKVGHIIGAKPWQQQIMLIIGVVISSLLIPIIMDKLFYAFGIVNVLPRPGMDPALTLSAPPANAIVGTVQSILNQNLPWNFLKIGAFTILLASVLQLFLNKFKIKLSIVCIAIGIYLPMTATIPMILGACVSAFANRISKENHLGTVLACGLITGAALMDVILAFGTSFHIETQYANLPTQVTYALAALFTLIVCFWFYSTARLTNKINQDI